MLNKIKDLLPAIYGDSKNINTIGYGGIQIVEG